VIRSCLFSNSSPNTLPVQGTRCFRCYMQIQAKWRALARLQVQVLLEITWKLKMAISCNTAKCSLTDRCFRGYNFHHQGDSTHHRDVRGNKLHWNVGKYLSRYIMLQLSTECLHSQHRMNFKLQRTKIISFYSNSCIIIIIIISLLLLLLHLRTEGHGQMVSILAPYSGSRRFKSRPADSLS
jgi:hypothetical protein